MADSRVRKRSAAGAEPAAAACSQSPASVASAASRGSVAAAAVRAQQAEATGKGKDMDTDNANAESGGVPADWKCAICLELLFEPVTLPCCRNQLCAPCLQHAIDVTTSQCPFCRKRLLSFSRRKGSKVNAALWQVIQFKYPAKCEKRRVAEAFRIEHPDNSSSDDDDDSSGSESESESDAARSDCTTDVDSDAEETAAFKAAVQRQRSIVAPDPGELRTMAAELAERQAAERQAEIAEQEAATLQLLAADGLDVEAFRSQQREAEAIMAQQRKNAQLMARDEEFARQSAQQHAAPSAAAAPPGRQRPAYASDVPDFSQAYNDHAADVAKAAARTWLCPACTYKNSTRWLRCEVCGMHKSGRMVKKQATILSMLRAKA